jgi:hypothetical protein
LKLVTVEPEPDQLASIINRFDGGGGNDEVSMDDDAGTNGEGVGLIRPGPVHRALDTPNGPASSVGDEKASHVLNGSQFRSPSDGCLTSAILLVSCLLVHRGVRSLAVRMNYAGCGAI